MYSEARSKMLGMDHSPLVELSGVGGGRDPILGVMAAETGGTRLLMLAEPGLRYAGDP